MRKNQFGITRMNLEHLKTFHVVASLGSFTEAAKALYMTQPAVSQQIQGIEHALRNPLFDRSKRQIRLTAKGKILFSYTQKLFGIFREIENVFSELNHLLTGELTIAASAVMGNYFLSSFIAEFYKKYPLISIRLEMGDSAYVTHLVEEGLADVALSRHVRNLKHCKQKLLIKEPYVCVCGPSSPLAALKRPLSAKEFAENYLVMRQKGSRMRSKLEEWFKSVGVYEFLSTPVIEVNSLESSKQLIARGFGATAFPSIAVRQELKRESLIMLSVENFSVTADYFLGYNDKRELSPAAFEFISLLTESMKPKDQI
ncbi:LysR family transcriptional regulator [Parasutterella excrementihominis]|uniref:LysR family transcriptional regulator n=1 Tax=Parasutterella excrementihominis TaxID=487175 RepID=UPI0027B8AE4D|nr:LysR family transcriptional regulator [Parasutterella excrementihominis]